MMIVTGKQAFSREFTEIISSNNKRVQVWVNCWQCMMEQLGGRRA
jgi:hypothetical protein